MTDRRDKDEAQSPLSQPVFRALWLATIASNIGTWMQDAGSGWLMTSLTTSPLMVALIQAATTMPVFALALPGGALADVIDRKRLLIGAQLVAVSAASCLAGATWLGWTTPITLLCVAAILGSAAALAGPAFQAIVPELVAPASLRQAIALNSLGVNISRAIGPALGGLTIAALGPAAVFAANGALTLSVAFVLFRWRRQPEPSALPPEHFRGAMVAAARYVRGAPDLRAVLVRAFSFFLLSSSLLALIPIIGRRDLALDAGHYGLLLGAMGIGAVAAAVVLKRFASRMASDTLVALACVAQCCAMLALAHAHSLVAAIGCMGAAGAAWITALSTLNAAAQRVAPAWVRARVLAIYLVSSQGGMAIGAVFWGMVATHVGAANAISLAGLALLATLPLGAFFPLPEGGNLAPAMDWPVPAGVPGEGIRGPVMVTVEYRIAPDHLEQFLAAAHQLERIRRRDGAYHWDIYEDVVEPGLLVEAFLVADWLEHLRQHGRHSVADIPVQKAVQSFHIGQEAPLVRHMIRPAP